MNKSELIAALSSKAEITKAEAAGAVDALFNARDGIITRSLKKGDRVQITGFGTFELRVRRARTGRNPRTGKEIRIAPTVSPSFRPGLALKKSLEPTDSGGPGKK